MRLCLAALGLAVACSGDAPTASHPQPASLLVDAGFAPSANFALTHATELGIAVDSFHLTVRRLSDSTAVIVDTTYSLAVPTADVMDGLTVPVQSNGERFDVRVEYRAGITAYFRGHGVLQSYTRGQTPSPQRIETTYAGPGANVARLASSGTPAGVLASQTLALSVSAFDSSNSAVDLPRLAWTSSDNTIATVSNAGVVTAGARRGAVTITATAASGASVSVPLAVTPPPASLTIVSGGGQSGKVGSTLANPVIVQVNAADGLGVPGVAVTLTAGAGGAVGASSAITVVTDASGRASTTLQLGSTSGPQSFAASAGALTASFAENALAGDAAAIVAAAGGGQSDTVRHTLANPLVARVTDRFGNGVGSVTVNWSRAGSGALGVPSSVTNTDGAASVSYTLGSIAGSDTVSASVAGVSGSASFIVSATTPPTRIVAVSGNAQIGVVNSMLAQPLVVRVTDDAGNLVGGATIRWSSTGGSIEPTTTTDAHGQTSARLMLGTTSGDVTATASLPNGRAVTFVAAANPGPGVAIEWLTQPSSGRAGIALSPAPQVAIVDEFGNLAGSNATVSVSLAGGVSGAVLSGGASQSASGGIATFDGLTINRVGTGYSLRASTSLFGASVESAQFGVTAGSPTQLLLIPPTATSVTVAAGSVVTSPQLEVADAFGNGVAGIPVHFVVTLDGTSTVLLTTDIATDASGFVTLSARMPNVPGVFDVSATSSAVPGALIGVTVTVTP
ncbi:MAG TPA: Ig-like domain-containing protein [Gemmatimonadaceae bacterium]|nr:Ig-like domain-containing protein [Gemmatimonadaceae bacterium]